MSLRTLSWTLASALTLAATLVATPAHAYSYPVFSPLDLSTPGHVKGTVTTDAPYVKVGVIEETIVPTSDGSASFDLETWGYDRASVYAFPCANTSPSSCAATWASVDFTPTDVVPTITWPTDLSIGPGETLSVTTSDPQGGGRLLAVWQGKSFWLDRNGTTEFDTGLADGSGVVVVYRCAANELRCNTPNPLTSPPLEVRRTASGWMTVGPANTYGGYVSTRQPSVDFLVSTGRSIDHPYSLQWHLKGTAGAVEGTGGTASGTLTGGTTTLPVTAAGVADGTYTVEGTITIQDPEFGELTGPLSSGKIIVDRTRPSYSAVTLSATTIYPNIGRYGYDKSVLFTFKGLSSSAKIEVSNPSGVVVRRVPLNRSSPTSTSWAGRWTGYNAQGNLVPPGGYTVRLVDAAGNLNMRIWTIRVSSRKLVPKTWRKTVTAAGSMVDQYVGRCSTLRKPAARGWAYSLGHYANTKCSTETTQASLVSTLHAMTVPKAAAYTNLKVSLYGGSATARPGSRGVIRYLTAAGRWTSESVVSASLGWHPGLLRAGSGMVYKDRSFAWGFYTGYGHRYDVQKFTVVVNYLTLG